MSRSRLSVLWAFCLALVLLPHIMQSAFGQVTVVLFQPPPNQLRVSDLWRVELFNGSRETVEIFLQGTATESKSGLIVDAESRIFKLPPGRLAVKGPQIEPIKVNQSNPRYRDIVTRTGTVPSGEYEICVYVRAADTREELGRDCITQVVERLSPPVLIAPMNEAEVEDQLPTFTWTPPVPLPAAGSRVTYRLRIAEIYGRQTAYDALQSNPAFFEKSDIPTTIVQYPSSSRSFETNKRYAWRVTALSGNVDLGESEVWEFTKKKPLKIAEELTVSEATIATMILAFKADRVFGGKGHSAALVGTEDMHIWTWGNNEYGQLGTGGVPATARATPKEVAALTYITAVAPGAEHSLALGPYGQVAAWGTNDYGQLGSGSADAANTPKWIPAFNGAKGIAAGNYHSVAVKGDGTVWAWGYNRSGELGLGDHTDRDKPTKVSGLSEVTAVAAGDGHTLALRADGTVWAWGTNRNGQADPSFGAEPIIDKPVKVEGLTNVQAIAAGGNFSLALLKDGTVKAWGANNSGQLGNGEADPDAKLIKKFITSKARTGSPGEETKGTFKNMKRSSGKTGGGGGDTEFKLYTFDVVEMQKSMELGYLATNLTGLVSVSGLTGATAIDAGGAHSIALRKDSTVWTWGNNHWGTLGTGDRSYHTGPTRVIGINDAVSIAAGSDHSFAVRKNGNVLAWGNNNSKQLGMDEVPASVTADNEQIAVSPVVVPKQ